MIATLRMGVSRLILHLLVAYILISSCAGLARVEQVKRRSNAIAPISIIPSQDWDGNDGPWSTFSLQIGTPPQPVKVLISTASSQTWAIAAEGCQSGDFTTCPQLRGGEYNHSSSSTWITNSKNSTTNIYALGLESALGYNGSDYRGRYGFDEITLGFAGSNGPTLSNQTIAEIALKAFFMGYFGLSAASSNFNDYDTPIQSYLYNLRNQSKIPSLSWAYTAGNQYRLNSVLGSLTLGGYDSSKFTPNELSFNVSQADNGYLGVVLDALTYESTNLLPDGPITTFLDSTLPYLYLPISACSIFESTFGLLWNDTSQLYIVNYTQHILLQHINPSITFTLSVPNITNSGTINITFPYAAFDLNASWPLVPDSARYFPLRRANDSTQYVLGRAFFQEAYVITDFERGNFSVSACKWDKEPQNLVAILPPNSNDASKPPLSVGAIAGIAAGGAVLILAIIAWIFWRKRQKQKERAELANTEIGGGRAEGAQQSEGYIKPELDGTSTSHIFKDGSNIAEADGGKVNPRQELDGSMNLTPIYEMPVNEEVAIEMLTEEGVKEAAAQRENRRSVASSATAGRWSWLRGGSGKTDSGVKRTDTNTSVSSGWRSTETRYSSLAQSLAGDGNETVSGLVEQGSVPRTEVGRVQGRRFHQMPMSPDDVGMAAETPSSVSSGWGGDGSGSGSYSGVVISPQTPFPGHSPRGRGRGESGGGGRGASWRES